jgi:hypothetical protein
MSGGIPPLLLYAFMAWCSVKAQEQLYLTFIFMSVMLECYNTGTGLPAHLRGEIYCRTKSELRSDHVSQPN